MPHFPSTSHIVPILVLLLSACGGSNSKNSTAVPSSYVRFAAPAAGARLRGLAELHDATGPKSSPEIAAGSRPRRATQSTG